MSTEKNNSLKYILLLVTIILLVSLCVNMFLYEEEEPIAVLTVDTGIENTQKVKEDKKMTSLPDYVNLIMGLVIPTTTRQWIVKLAGPASEFKDIQPMFEKLRSTIKFDDYSVEVVTFELTEGWVKTREKGFIHSSITHPDLKTKITISSAQGTLIDNINRWRRQLGMGPISAAMLAQMVDMKFISMTNVNGYFAIAVPIFKEADAAPNSSPHPPMQSPDIPNSENSEASSQGIRVAFGLAKDQTWYIKMTGSSNALILQKNNFESFVKSFKFSGAKPEWTVPQDWTDAGGGGMSVGTFTVADAKVTVTPLAANSGSLEDNVNRWRGQISLPSASLEDIQKSLQTLKVDGNDFNYLFISSTSAEAGLPENHPKIDNGGGK